jgi:hypothetical protein
LLPAACGIIYFIYFLLRTARKSRAKPRSIIEKQ